jgi:hypothetical protein
MARRTPIAHFPPQPQHHICQIHLCQIAQLVRANRQPSQSLLPLCPSSRLPACLPCVHIKPSDRRARCSSRLLPPSPRSLPVGAHETPIETDLPLEPLALLTFAALLDSFRPFVPHHGFITIRRLMATRSPARPCCPVQQRRGVLATSRCFTNGKSPGAILCLSLL